MVRPQAATGLLRALGPCIRNGLTPQCQQIAAAAAGVRLFESVAPAVTYRDISDEWYLRQRSQISLGNRLPHVAVSAWISPSAVVVGDVDLLDRASVWNNVVLRGDLNNITIGQVSNVQDRTVIHAARTSPAGISASVKIGKFVTIEPNCTLRSCRVGDFCKVWQFACCGPGTAYVVALAAARVGARSVLLEGSMMEEYSVLQPGSVLPPTRRVPTGEVWGGVPARFVRPLSADERDALKAEADDIRRLAWQQTAEQLPVGTAWRPVEAYRASVVAAGKAVSVPMRRLKYDQRKKREEEAANAISVSAGASQAIK